MRRLTLMLVLSASLLLVGSAGAGPVLPSPESLARIAIANVVVPTEWDGVWTTVDSTYNCELALQSTSTSVDTICGGRDYGVPTEGMPFTYTCTGTADANGIHSECTASYNLAADCQADYSVVTDGWLTGNSYRMVTFSRITYTGTGMVCGLLTPSCTQFDSWGTRTGPAPTVYCATGTKVKTWGELKSHYR
jgi:hypothetical protein